MITLLIEKFPYNLGLGSHMTKAFGSSGTMSMAMSSFISNLLLIALFNIFHGIYSLDGQNGSFIFNLMACTFGNILCLSTLKINHIL